MTAAVVGDEVVGELVCAFTKFTSNKNIPQFIFSPLSLFVSKKIYFFSLSSIFAPEPSIREESKEKEEMEEETKKYVDGLDALYLMKTGKTMADDYADVVQKLERSLLSGNTEEMKWCIRSCENLVRAGIKFEHIGLLRGVHLEDPELARGMVTLVGVMTLNPKNRAPLVKAGALQILRGALGVKGDEMLVRVLAVLINLSCQERDAKASLVRAGALDLLLEIMGNNKAKGWVQQKCIQVLANLAVYPINKACMTQQGFDKLIQSVMGAHPGDVDVQLAGLVALYRLGVMTKADVDQKIKVKVAEHNDLVGYKRIR